MTTKSTALAVAFLFACAGGTTSPSGNSPDAGEIPDAGDPDAGPPDAGNTGTGCTIAISGGNAIGGTFDCGFPVGRVAPNFTFGPAVQFEDAAGTFFFYLDLTEHDLGVPGQTVSQGLISLTSSVALPTTITQAAPGGAIYILSYQEPTYSSTGTITSVRSWESYVAGSVLGTMTLHFTSVTPAATTNCPSNGLTSQAVTNCWLVHGTLQATAQPVSAAGTPVLATGTLNLNATF
jgi:hypothetical protein